MELNRSRDCGVRANYISITCQMSARRLSPVQLSRQDMLYCIQAQCEPGRIQDLDAISYLTEHSQPDTSVSHRASSQRKTVCSQCRPQTASGKVRFMTTNTALSTTLCTLKAPETHFPEDEKKGRRNQSKKTGSSWRLKTC